MSSVDETESHLPPRHAPLPDLDGGGRRDDHRTPSPDEFVRVQDSEEFGDLRSTFRRFAFPMTAAFLAWYLLYVLLSTYATDLMSTPVLGSVNLGLLLGLGQFASTFLITYLYVRHANRRLDPSAERLRHELEGDL
ncbi:DUF485 domain-containing protein [Cellulomonas marina]|uniref:Uncharacterized membrane protein, DUF485 family n=1 Tax=Cellulomonas marina TaxID=988821 RepID=A0A1I0XNN9_9CELL|nr:DUF485 domain-containing protein [Cellulomonas marina]GIG30681.1 hypothetical protein Cma02nite_32810 [Cellulomonas marina]SFB02056.1 Uncharacterized membrane protein, DUF485 family [Cellulomonas marina]